MAINGFLLVVELWLLGGVALTLHRLSPRYGLTLLLAYLGGLGGLAQILFPLEVFIQLPSGLAFTLGANLFTPILLFGMLIIYATGGATSMRLGQYVIIGVSGLNLIVTASRALHLALPGSGTLGGLPVAGLALAQSSRETIASFLAFMAALRAIAVIHQAASNRRVPAWLTPGLSLLAALWTHTVFFSLLALIGTPRLAGFFSGLLIGNTMAALLLWPVAAFYLIRIAPRPPEHLETQSHPAPDLPRIAGAFGDMELALTRSERRTQRLNRILRTISDINQLIVREQDRERLLKFACEVLARGRDYVFVWVGLLAEDGVTVRFAAASGPANPDDFTCRLDGPGPGPQCVPAAIRDRAPLRVEPLADSDPCLNCPLRARNPHRSSVALPLQREARIAGAMVIHADTPNAFDTEEIDLLQELADDLAFALEKLDTDEQLRTQARHLTLLNDITRAALAAPDLQTMLHTLAEWLHELLGADSSYLTLWDDARQRVFPEVIYGPLRETRSATSAKPGETPLTEVVLRAGRAIAVDDINLLPEEQRRVASRFPSRSGIGLPLIAGEEKLGGLFIAFNQPHHFTLDEIARSEQAAAQVALAILKAKSLEAERKQLQLAKTLQEVGALLTAQMKLDEVFERIFDLLARAVAYDSASVQLFDEAEGGLYLAAGRGFPDLEQAKQFARAIPLSKIEERWSRRRVLVISDTRHDERWIKSSGDEYIHSWVGAALLVKGKFSGVLNVDSATTLAYGEAEGETVLAFANQAAVAIENARLYSEVQTKADELARLYAAAQDLSASLEPELVLQQLARHMAEALAVTSSYITAMDQEKETLTVLAEYWSEDATPAERTSDLGRVYSMRDYPTVMQAVLAGEAVSMQAGDPGLSEVEKRQLADYGIKSMLFVPIAAHGRVFGDAEIWESRQPRIFTPAQIRLARTLAGHAASVIENARLFEAEHRRADELEVLAQVASTLRQAQTREAMLPLLVEVATSLFHADTGALLLLEGETLTLAAAHNKALEPLVGSRHPPDEGLIWRTIRDGRLAFISDIAALEEPVLSELCRAITDGMRACSCIPLQTAEDTVGLLFFAFRAPHTPSADEIRLLTAIAEMGGAAIHRTTLHEQTERHAAELALAYDTTLEGWARALELRDEITEGHTRRVTELTLRLARAMGLSEAELIHIRRGALLHDIGKMGISDSILLKPGPLSAREEMTMRLHPDYAFAMLSPIAFLRPALDIPHCHHERWDGAGYPRRLKGEQIPLAARIFAIADVWDALTSDRPYRPAWPPEKVLEHIREQSGRHFDPRVADVFLQIVSG